MKEDTTEKFFQAIKNQEVEKVAEMLATDPLLAMEKSKRGEGAVFCAISCVDKRYDYYKLDIDRRLAEMNSCIENALKLFDLLYMYKADFNMLIEYCGFASYESTPLAYAIWEMPFTNKFLIPLINYGADIEHPSVEKMLKTIKEMFSDNKDKKALQGIEIIEAAYDILKREKEQGISRQAGAVYFSPHPSTKGKFSAEEAIGKEWIRE